MSDYHDKPFLDGKTERQLDADFNYIFHSASANQYLYDLLKEILKEVREIKQQTNDELSFLRGIVSQKHQP